MSYERSHINEIRNTGSRLGLVATKLPKGKLLYVTPGVSESPERLEVFARKIDTCPSEIFIVSAEEVGLEWVGPAGKVPWGDERRKTMFCVLRNA